MHSAHTHDEELDDDPALKKSHPRLFFAILLFLVFLLQWMSAGYSVLSKGAYNTGLSPVILCMYRDFTVTLMLLAVTWYFDGKPVVDNKHLPRLMLCGVSGVFCTQFFYTFGIKLTGADVGSVMQLLTPIFTTVLSMIMGFEKPYLDRVFGWIRIFGLSCALGGAAYILFGSISSSQSPQSRTDTTLGYTFFLINTAAAAIFINFQKPLLHIMPTTRVIFWNYVFGAMSMGFASLYFVNDPSAWSIQTSIGLYALAYAIVFGSFFIYIIISFVNKHSNPVLVTMFHPFGVLCVAVLSKIFLNEEFSSRDMLGAAFIVAGLMFVSYAQYASQKATEAESIIAENSAAASDVLSDVVRDHQQPLLVGTVNR